MIRQALLAVSLPHHSEPSTLQFSLSNPLRGLNQSLQHRLVFLVVAAGVVPAVLVALIAHVALARALASSEDFSKASLHQQVEEGLTSVRDNQRVAIERYFRTITDQVESLATDPQVIRWAEGFCASFESFGPRPDDVAAKSAHQRSVDRFYRNDFANKYAAENHARSLDVGDLTGSLSETTLALQAAYIADNPAALGEKDSLTDDGTGSAYSAVHREAHPVLRDFLDRFGYYDVFLADAETGHVVYSVFKEIDFATSLKDGPYAGSGLGQAFAAGLNLNDAGSSALVDFAPYLPSYEAPAGFVASPVKSGGRTIAVAIFQMPLDRISETMGIRSGLGETGEAYLLGPDARMRSDSFRDPDHRTVAASFSLDSGASEGTVRSEGAMAAARGETGVIRHVNYAGVETLCAYVPVDIPGLAWTLLTEIEVSEALAPIELMRERSVRNRRTTALTIGLGVLLTSLLIACLARKEARKIMTPIIETQEALVLAATGDLSARVHVDGEDEIAGMAVALNTLTDGVASALHGRTVDWAEVASQRSALARVESLVRSSPIGLIFANQEGEFQHVNPSAKKLMRLYSRVLGGTGSGTPTRVADLGAKAGVDLASLGANGKTETASIEMGGEAFELSITEAVGEDGVTIGLVAALERTTDAVQAAKRALEFQAAELRKAEQLRSEADVLLGAVSAASQGDLTVTMPAVEDPSMAEIGRGLSTLLAGMRAQIGAILETGRELDGSAKELSQIADNMGVAASTTTAGAGDVTARSSDVDERVAVVATATGQLEVSINEIHRNASEAAGTAQDASSQAKDTSEQVQRLKANSEEIGEVIRIIGTIAAQTNLLALNASIEAARAGQHGQGFSVVANEVKLLANETTSATSAVAERIEGIQKTSQQLSADIAQFTQTVETISVKQASIASAVEEQSAATREIGESAAAAAAESGEIRSSLEAVAAQAEQTSAGALQTSDSAARVGQSAQRLNEIVAAFKV